MASDRCRCGAKLPAVKPDETPFEFCSSRCAAGAPRGVNRARWRETAKVALEVTDEATLTERAIRAWASTVLRLLDELEAAERERDEAHALLDKLRPR